MDDNLTVRLDDQASRGLHDIATKLDDLQATSNRAAQGTENLNQAMDRQTKAIQDGVSWWSAFKIAIADATVSAGASVAGFFAKLTALTVGANAALSMTAKAVRALGPEFEPLAKGIDGYTLKWENAGNLVGKATKKIGFELAGLGEAEAALGTMTLGAYASYKAFEAVLASTGKEARLTTEAQERIARSLAYTNEQLEAMPDNAEKAAIMLDRLNASTGRQLAVDLGEVKSNLDRVNDELGKFSTIHGQSWETAKDVVHEYADSFVEYMTTPSDAWKAFSDDVTRRADFMIENIRAVIRETDGLNPFARSAEDAAQFQKVADAQAKNAEGFDRLAAANKRAQDASDARADRERINSIKSVEAVNNEIEALRQKAAANGGLKSKEDEKKFTEELIALMNRIPAIQKENAAAEKKADDERLQREKEHAKAVAEAMKRQQQHTDALLESQQVQNELYDLERKRLGVQQQLAEDAQNHVAATAQKASVDVERTKLDIQKQQTAEKMKLGGATDSQVKTMEYQADRKFAEESHARAQANIEAESKLKIDRLRAEKDQVDQSSGAEAEKIKQRIKLQGDIDKSIAEFAKQRADENLQFLAQQKIAALQQAAQIEEEKFRLVKERHEREKQLLLNAAGQQFDPKQALQSQDPALVLKNLQEKRAIDAANKQGDKDADLYNRGLAGDKAAQTQFDRNQRIAENKARQSVVNDFNNGKLKDGEVADVQARMATQVVQQGAQQGAVNQDVAKFMIEALNQTAGQQVAIDQLRGTIKQLNAIQQGQKAAQQNSANEFKSQMMSLFQ